MKNFIAILFISLAFTSCGGGQDANVESVDTTSVASSVDTTVVDSTSTATDTCVVDTTKASV